MNRTRTSSLLVALALALAAGTLAACDADDHAGHDHGPGEPHEPSKDTK